MTQDERPGRDETTHERAHEDECAEPIARRRPPGVPPGANEDQEGYDESVAESFPASDPPANY